MFFGFFIHFVTIPVSIIILSSFTAPILHSWLCQMLLTMLLSLLQSSHNNNLTHSILNVISSSFFTCSCSLTASVRNQKDQSKNHSFLQWLANLHVFEKLSSELGDKVHAHLILNFLSAALGNLTSQGKMERRKLCREREQLVHSYTCAKAQMHKHLDL